MNESYNFCQNARYKSVLSSKDRRKHLYMYQCWNEWWGTITTTDYISLPIQICTRIGWKSQFVWHNIGTSFWEDMLCQFRICNTFCSADLFLFPNEICNLRILISCDIIIFIVRGAVICCSTYKYSFGIWCTYLFKLETQWTWHTSLNFDSFWNLWPIRHVFLGISFLYIILAL